MSAISPGNLPAHLGRLARRLSRETRQPVLSHATEALLLSPHPLSPDAAFRVLATETFNLSEPQHRRFLKQLLDQHTAYCFRQWEFKVDDYGKKAFFQQRHRITHEIEALHPLGASH